MDLSIARKPIEMLYTDTCNVVEYQSVTDPVTHITCPNHEEVTVLENVPCRVSHKNITTAGTGVAPAIELISKLIINPDVPLKPGSKIRVTRNGVTTVYKCSGEPARYHNHQEIMIELEDKYA